MVLIIVYQEKVIYISTLPSDAQIMFNIVVEHGHIKIGEYLTCKVYDRQSTVLLCMK